MRRGGDGDRARDHTAEHGFHAQGFRDLNHAVRFQHPAAFVELDIDAIIRIAQFGDVGCVLAGFVRNDGDVHAAANPAGILDAIGRERLLDEFDALFFEPVDFADSFFAVLPTFVGIYAQRLVRDAAHGFDGRLIGSEPDFYLQYGVRGGFASLLFGDFRRVDADGECGERRVFGIETEIGIERNTELLANPVHERD